MTSRETCFLCFVQHRARFCKCLCDYFGLKQVKASKKNLARAIYKEETEGTRALYNLRMPKNIIATSLLLPHFDVIVDLLLNNMESICLTILVKFR